MIKTVADLLDNLRQRENQFLKTQNVDHPPTIGLMYEGLTKEIVNRAIPLELDLRVVSGFIENEEGELSSQMDCLLVRGEGKNIPYTDTYKYNSNNVLAVIEVKKNLYSTDLKSGYKNLFSTSRFIAPTAFTKGQALLLRDAFRSITRMHLPTSKENVLSLPFHVQMIYHTLLTEIIKPIRILLGYNGFSSEYNLRESFVNYLEKNLSRDGYSPGSFPNLIICNNYSLVKATGMPFTGPLIDDLWHFYFSANSNPLLLFLELIWTRLSYVYDVPSTIFGDDLDIDFFHPCLWGKCVERSSDQRGWMMGLIDIRKDDLQELVPSGQWEPEFLDKTQFAIVTELCDKEFIDITDEEFIQFVETSGYEIEELIKTLISKNLVTVDKQNRLSLITDACVTLVLPDGSYIAGENKSGRLIRWVDKFMEKWRQK